MDELSAVVDNFHLYLYGKDEKTCCFSKYKYSGDYIFDSEKRENTIVEIDKTKFMSDHYPIIKI